MSTPIVDSTSYATPADFLARLDSRDIAQWVSDAGQPVSLASLPTNPNLLAALADASGMIESAALVSQRYSVADLQALITAGGNSASYLKRLTCDLALGLLIERRPYLGRALPKQYERALEALEELRSGKRIFAFVEVAQAGNPKATMEPQTDVANRNLSSFQAQRFFGNRADTFLPGNNPGAGFTTIP